MANDPDAYMVRHHNDGYNLSVGEPVFLQQKLDFLTIIEPIFNLHYPLVGGEKDLLKELHKLHPNFKHIVVTNGAKQGLLASFYALNQNYDYETISVDRKTKEEIKYKHTINGSSLVYTPAPHWPSFPTLAKLSNIGFTHMQDAAAIKLLTSPNNPDGLEVDDSVPCDIWDAAYYNPLYPVYGHTHALTARISVFSGAKMFGVSSFRIGWVGTNDDRIAKFVAEYVEKSTTGVSVLSQTQMSGILRHTRLYGDGKLELEKASKVLESNAESFHRYLDKYLDLYKGAPKGMFTFVKVRDLEKFQNALATAKVQVVPGRACGMQEDGWFRFSIGWQPEYLDPALRELKKVLDE
jgi:histidinol-phosphate/aromatic aminotransferase/cobyric acid decarboxylase-like protein